eukprot:TRINITY_DN31122_c0_g1_i1.p1 TRINITY_DN31122_c0_g1~~TRINITY_DN31122_c0_g1_i1.p1  ORF type:complete len:345 (+),score=82.61 TRINITY_DN31122_c0_g1_i1:85-1119(+)
MTEKLAARLPANAWCRVAGYLYAHEVLGRFGSICARLCAVLGEETCWRTLALPPGRPDLLERFLSLIMVEEKSMWAPALKYVELVAFDCMGCSLQTADQLRELLKSGLDLEGTVRVVSLANLPAFHVLAEAPAGPGTLRARDIELVNPVIPTAKAALQCSFLLEQGDLQQLRFSMAPFCYFRLGPAEPSKKAEGQGSLLTLLALRGEAELCNISLACLPRSVSGPTDGCSLQAGDEDPLSYAFLELGGLRKLPMTKYQDRQGRSRNFEFDMWRRGLAVAYELLANTGNLKSAALLGGPVEAPGRMSSLTTASTMAPSTTGGCLSSTLSAVSAPTLSTGNTRLSM